MSYLSAYDMFSSPTSAAVRTYIRTGKAQPREEDNTPRKRDVGKGDLVICSCCAVSNEAITMSQLLLGRRTHYPHAGQRRYHVSVMLNNEERKDDSARFVEMSTHVFW